MEKGLKSRSLSDVTVLDFTGELGPYASKLYAGLGAEVIHLEPISGDPLRQKGPFYKNETDNMEASLQFLYYNGNKKSLVIDLHREAGRKIFRRLIRDIDIFMESCVPGFLNDLGLSYDTLKKINSKLVQISITPYGSMGLYKDYPESDLTCSAMGGFLYLGGVESNKPGRAYDNPSCRMAESCSAVRGSIPLLHAQKTGEGQLVDVSVMESVGIAFENAAQYWDLEGTLGRSRGKETSATIHPCRDGYIALVAVMGKNKILWEPFVNWMKDENVDGWEVFEDPKWLSPSYKRSEEGYRIFCSIFHRFTLRHDKMTLYGKGQAHCIALAPVSNGKDLLENPRLKHRNFWQTIEHENFGGEITCPGIPNEFGELDWRFGFPAPAFGEHTALILEGLDYTREEIAHFSKEGVIHGHA